jgi:hypothetical protein
MQRIGDENKRNKHEIEKDKKAIVIRNYKKGIVIYKANWVKVTHNETQPNSNKSKKIKLQKK